MKRTIIIYISLCSLLNMVANNFVPYRNVETTDDGVIVTYRFRGGIHQQDPLYPNAKYWKIPGFGLNEESGKPSTLSRWDSFAIPYGANVSVEVLECEYTDTAFVLAPARHALFNNDTIGYTLDNVPPITAYAGFYPTDIIEMSGITNYRGQDIQRIEVHPIQYSHTNGIVRNYSLIKYRINFDRTNSRSINPSNVKISPTDPIINNMVLNPTDIIKSQPVARTYTEGGAAIEDNRDYLIVSVPKYEEAVNNFAEWKRKMGYRVHVVLRNYWNRISLKSVIQQLYNQVGINLYYFLIVGDIDDIPAYDGSNTDYVYATDFYYSCMGDEYDYIPDISKGRIPVNSNEEATIVFNKIINYEQCPFSESSFYNKGVHCAYFQDLYPRDNYADRRFAQTSEEVRNYMMYLGKDVDRIYYTFPQITPLHWNNGNYSFGEEIPAELQKPAFSWDGDYNNIINSINDGCFYILYRGHGEGGYWCQPYFDENHINVLNNGNKLPVVFSICCNTGTFDYPSSDGFAETFLKKNNGGCVGIIAATEKSYSGHNDILTETMFDAIWPDSILRIKLKKGSDNREINPEPIYELGRVLDIGMNYMEEVSLNAELDENKNLYTRELFHYFGDPSMMIRTEEPQVFLPNIERLNDTIFVNTNCEGTRISFYTPSTGQTNSYIGKNISYPTTSDSVIVCINKHNYIPIVAYCGENIYIQNDTINNTRYYIGENILVGKNVTTLKEGGEVIIQNANVKFQGKEVILHSGTTITNSNVEINTDN